jgi:hypothetical protein
MPIVIKHYCNKCKIEVPCGGGDVRVELPASVYHAGDKTHKEELCGACYREFIAQLVPLVEKYLGKPCR